MLGVLTFHESREAPMDEYDGRQFVGIDLHRQRSVIVRQTESGEQLSAVRIVNDPVALKLQLEEAGADRGVRSPGSKPKRLPFHPVVAGEEKTGGKRIRFPAPGWPPAISG